MIAFLVEGAIDDWSGVFMTLEKGIDISRSGLGLTLFTAASFITRLAGDTLPCIGGRGAFYRCPCPLHL